MLPATVMSKAANIMASHAANKPEHSEGEILSGTLKDQPSAQNAKTHVCPSSTPSLPSRIHPRPYVYMGKKQVTETHAGHSTMTMTLPRKQVSGPLRPSAVWYRARCALERNGRQGVVVGQQRRLVVSLLSFQLQGDNAGLPVTLGHPHKHNG